MKKLALVMVFVLLMALFIAFNYLLWDRENREAMLKDLENKNADVNASVSVQNRELKNLEDDNASLQSTIEQLEKDKLQLQQEKDQAAQQTERVSQDLTDKVAMLNQLKQLIDAKQLEEPVNKWVDAIDTGKYEDAYNLEYENLYSKDKVVSLSEYSDNLKKTVKSITIKSIKLDPGMGTDTGEIYLLASLDVKLAENAAASSSRFLEGINELHFKMGFDSANNVFVISEIT